MASEEILGVTYCLYSPNHIWALTHLVVLMQKRSMQRRPYFLCSVYGLWLISRLRPKHEFSSYIKAYSQQHLPWCPTPHPPSKENPRERQSTGLAPSLRYSKTLLCNSRKKMKKRKNPGRCGPEGIFEKREDPSWKDRMQCFSSGVHQTIYFSFLTPKYLALFCCCFQFT